MSDLELVAATTIDRLRGRVLQLGQERAALVAEAQLMRLTLEDERRATAAAVAELEATRARTDALYDVLGAARRLMAAELLHERGTLDELERNAMLQDLRTMLAETRNDLLTLPRAPAPESAEAANSSDRKET